MRLSRNAIRIGVAVVMITGLVMGSQISTFFKGEELLGQAATGGAGDSSPPGICANQIDVCNATSDCQQRQCGCEAQGLCQKFSACSNGCCTPCDCNQCNSSSAPGNTGTSGTNDSSSSTQVADTNGATGVASALPPTEDTCGELKASMSCTYGKYCGPDSRASGNTQAEYVANCCCGTAGSSASGGFSPRNPTPPPSRPTPPPPSTSSTPAVSPTVRIPRQPAQQCSVTTCGGLCPTGMSTDWQFIVGNARGKILNAELSQFCKDEECGVLNGTGKLVLDHEITLPHIQGCVFRAALPQSLVCSSGDNREMDGWEMTISRQAGFDMNLTSTLHMYNAEGASDESISFSLKLPFSCNGENFFEPTQAPADTSMCNVQNVRPMPIRITPSPVCSAFTPLVPPTEPAEPARPQTPLKAVFPYVPPWHEPIYYCTGMECLLGGNVACAPDVCVPDKTQICMRCEAPTSLLPPPESEQNMSSAGEKSSSATTRTVLRTTRCGNGVIEGNEQCDDGNLVDSDSCSRRCLLGNNQECSRDTQCASKQCIKGHCEIVCTRNDQCPAPQICTNGSCKNPRCGDKVVTEPEQCDLGDTCTSDIQSCNRPIGTKDALCTCDPEQANCPLPPGVTFSTACIRSYCGNGVIDNLAVKDGKAVNYDLQHEVCDDGELNGTVASLCKTDCTFKTSDTCGDGVEQRPEECDDGMQNSDTQPNACRTICRNAYCGDAVVDRNEECDIGQNNGHEGSLCTAECRVASTPAATKDLEPAAVPPQGLVDIPFMGGTTGGASRSSDAPLLTPLATSHAPVGQSGPATLAAMAFGAAAGWAYVRRRRNRTSAQ